MADAGVPAPTAAAGASAPTLAAGISAPTAAAGASAPTLAAGISAPTAAAALLAADSAVWILKLTDLEMRSSRLPANVSIVSKSMAFSEATSSSFRSKPPSASSGVANRASRNSVSVTALPIMASN